MSEVSPQQLHLSLQTNITLIYLSFCCSSLGA